MTYYRVYVFNGTKEIPVLRPYKSMERLKRKPNQPYRIKPITA